MKKIDIRNLTDIDFEVFSKDILEHELNFKFRTFKHGKDRGIFYR